MITCTLLSIDFFSCLFLGLVGSLWSWLGCWPFLHCLCSFVVRLHNSFIWGKCTTTDKIFADNSFSVSLARSLSVCLSDIHMCTLQWGVNRGMQIYRSVSCFCRICWKAKLFVQIRNHIHIKPKLPWLQSFVDEKLAVKWWKCHTSCSVQYKDLT